MIQYDCAAPVNLGVRPLCATANRKSNAVTIEYREANASDYEQVRSFLSGLGWAKRVQDVERFEAMMDGADRTVIAREGERIVGFARALCDGVSNGYISMVAVAPECRGRGIGRGLVERVMAGDDSGHITWVLRAGRESRGFWERLGFKASSIAMERERTG
jgi:N-acetylglutamate synthase-like GNAT family acetyltransferase